jgi:hypothetical protein
MSQVLEDIEKQKKVITNTVLSYLALFPQTSKVESSKFEKEFEWYYEDEELIPENDLLPIAEEFIVNILREYKLDTKIDKAKLHYFFENSEDIDACSGDSVLDNSHDSIADFLYCDMKTKNKKTLQEWEEKRDKFYEALNTEIESYTEIILKYKDNMKITKNFKNFVNLFKNHELMVLHVFIVRTIFQALKKKDFMIETNKIKVLIKEMTILSRGIKLFRSIEKEAGEKDFSNEAYLEFLDKYKKDYAVTVRYLHYQFILHLINEAKKSMPIREMLIKAGINKITINRLLQYYSHNEKDIIKEGMKDTFYDVTIRDFTVLKSKYPDSSLSVVYLSFNQLDENHNIKIVRDICGTAASSYNFFAFEKDGIFDLWTNNHTKVDVLFLEDAYDLRNENNFFAFRSKYPDFFLKTKVILLSTNKPIENKKELMKLSSNVMALPLEQEITHKYLLTL